MRTTLLIAGMKDNSCRERVAHAIESLVGVDEVQVNIFRASAVVDHNESCTRADIISAIKQAGFAASESSFAP